MLVEFLYWLVLNEIRFFIVGVQIVGMVYWFCTPEPKAEQVGSRTPLVVYGESRSDES